VIVRVAAVVLPLAIAAAGGEIFLRLARPVAFRAPVLHEGAIRTGSLLHQRSTTPGLLYEPAPGASGNWLGAEIRINAHGLRGAEVDPARSPSILRIATVGGSFTFGYGVSDEGTYPIALERVLNERAHELGEKVEVLNFGVSGYGIREEVALIEHKLPPWEPDLVIVGYVFNDPETDPVQPLGAFFSGTAWWQRSHFLRLAAKARFDLEVRRLGDGNYLRALHRNARKWEGVRRAFREIRAASDHRGFEILLMIFPAIPPPPRGKWADYEYSDLHAKVREAAEEAGLEVFDLFDVLSARDPRTIALADGHPSPPGNEVIARAIADRLCGEGGGFFEEPPPAIAETSGGTAGSAPPSTR
jgi:lysophospholipase L1-like esterase